MDFLKHTEASLQSGPHQYQTLSPKNWNEDKINGQRVRQFRDELQERRKALNLDP